MPTVLRAGKYRFFFFSKEGTEPVHIHVDSGDDYAKFWLNPVQLAKSIGYNSTEIGKLKKLVAENEQSFKEKWNEHFSIQDN
jgi:hypothetical protein